MKRMMEFGLLDYLAYYNHCFISDLPFLPSEMLLQSIHRLSLDMFKTDEWNEALDYLCGVKISNTEENSASDIRELIICLIDSNIRRSAHGGRC